MEHLIFWMTYVMWIPLCATFAGLLYTRELAAKRHQEVKERIMSAVPDTRPEWRGDAPLPWKSATWGRYAL